MNFGSLFAGIGGFDYGLEQAGMQSKFQIEIDPYCRRVLQKHWPQHTIIPDVRGFKGNGDEHIDLLCGGFPCQDLSVAGKRAGLKGERSGLFWEIIRIQKIVQAKWGLFENVPGLLSSSDGRDMWAVLQGLRECWPAVGYRILDSRYFGVPQRRRRVFFVCGPSSDCVEQVLFESEGGAGYSKTGKKAGPRVAETIRGGSVGTRSHGKPSGSDQQEMIVVSNALQERGGKGADSDCTQTLVFATLNSGGNQGGFRTEPGEHLVAAPITAGLAKGPAVNDGNRGGPQNMILMNGVRRLTPTECERLQGFPDGWTCLCQPMDTYDPMACRCPDGPRYRALGNAVTTNVIFWIGTRLQNMA